MPYRDLVLRPQLQSITVKPESPNIPLSVAKKADGSIRVGPVDPSPMKAFRGMGRRGGSSQRLLSDREAERQAAD